MEAWCLLGFKRVLGGKHVTVDHGGATIYIYVYIYI